MYNIKTRNGNIGISHGAVGKAILLSILPFEEQLWLSNKKGRIANINPEKLVFTAKDYIDIQEGENGLDIKINIVIKFGNSIYHTTEKLIQNIRYSLKEYLDIEPDNILVTITGVMSKAFSPRNIEVIG